MKDVLVIQQDDAYFLYETLRVLEKYSHLFDDSRVTVLCQGDAINRLPRKFTIPNVSLVTEEKSIAGLSFARSYNFSMNEKSWLIQSKVSAQTKTGPELSGDRLKVKGDWSAYLMTLKARAPFLAFHLQDIYKNILDIKSVETGERKTPLAQNLVFGFANTDLFPANEQEKLIQDIHQKYPLLRIRDASEVDLTSDQSVTIYIGPATLQSLELVSRGARGIFLTRNFQGLNLLPVESGNYLISSRNGRFHAQELYRFFDALMSLKTPEFFPDLSYFETTHEHIFGTYLRALNNADEVYPIYQAHVVLWNFVLNLFEVNLETLKSTPAQQDLIRTNLEVMKRLARLHEYALSSINTILDESKSSTARADVVEGHLKNLRDISETDAKIAESHPFIRPILDFYHMRKGRDDGDTLIARAQDSLLSYSEEHHALKAFEELLNAFIP